MRWYRVWAATGEIKAVEMVKMTEKTITIQDGPGTRTEKLKGVDHFYTPRWDIAHAHILEYAEGQLKKYRSLAFMYEKSVEKIKGMPAPE